ncbi:MAG: ABC transporter ATP-binding protein [Azospirillaceae bacterium]|nr:ABC transporter ATP-binding protein [Azospirillaceae bacterium]
MAFAADPATVPSPVLAIDKLSIGFDGRSGFVTVVAGVGFSVHRGEILGLVGESGSGKSVTALSILGLIDPPGRVSGGEIRFHGEDLIRIGRRRQRTLRGNRIAMIFQDPMSTLNPVLTIESQIVEALRAHRTIDRAAARHLACEALGRAGIPAPEHQLKVYPHQLSGGMRQRVAIAIALLHRPDLLIADEPTTALDVTIQAQILRRIQELVRETGMALIWITHDLAVVSGLADRLCVFYAGRVVETGPTATVIGRPRHPYTKGLIEARPGYGRRSEPLAQIPGMMPSPLALPPGCSFQPRCPRAIAACAVMPELTGDRHPVDTGQAPGHCWRCVNPEPSLPSPEQP